MSDKTETENHTPRILLIDDDEEFTDDLIFLLDGPYEIVAVHESKKGIELLQTEKFDLVILDLMMPGFYADEDDREGIEVLKMIRKKWVTEKGKKVPVIILTGIVKPLIKQIVNHLDVDAFFAKPPIIETFKRKIDELLKTY